MEKSGFLSCMDGCGILVFWDWFLGLGVGRGKDIEGEGGGGIRGG